MSPTHRRWVVDASVVMKLFLPEDHSAQAQSFFGLLTQSEPAQFFVPDLLYAECANILWKRVKRLSYPVKIAKENLSDLKLLPLRPVSNLDLMEQALELSVRWDVSAYDACYLALADRLKAPLMTADERLCQKLKNSALSVQWIGNYPRSEKSSI